MQKRNFPGIAALLSTYEEDSAAHPPLVEPSTPQGRGYGPSQAASSTGTAKKTEAVHDVNLEIALNTAGKPHTVLIPDKLMLKVRSVAKKENTTVKDVISQCLALGLSRWEAKNGVISEQDLQGYCSAPLKVRKKLLIG